MRRAVAPLVFVLVLAACAVAPVSSPLELTPLPRTDIRQPLIPAALGRVWLGYTPEDATEGAILVAALTDALRSSNIFDDRALDTVDVELAHLAVDPFVVEDGAVGEILVSGQGVERLPGDISVEPWGDPDSDRPVWKILDGGHTDG